MIEGFFVERHIVKGSPFVVGMARNTIFVLHLAMKAFILEYHAFDFFVAVQTFLVGYSACRFMAF